MIYPCEGVTHVFSREIHAAWDVVEVEINYTRVVDMDLAIALRSHLSGMS